MRYLFGFLAAFCLSGPVLAKAPVTSLTPVARMDATAAPVVAASNTTPERAGLAGFRPSARPEVFEAALAAQLLRRMTRLEPVERAEPLPFMEPLLAFATATPQAVARTLRPERRSQSLVQRVMAQRQQEVRGSVCGDPAIQGERVGFVPGRISACGIDDAVRVRSVDGIALTQQPMIDCRTAKAFKQWVNRGVKPAIGSRGGGVARLRVAAHYACRTRNNQPGAKVSEHGKGRAIDISGIILRDGSEITVLQGWNTARDGQALRQMHGRACGIFGTVLGPESDRFHQDHFHFDTARHRNGSYCR
ncbi:extensin-like protein [Thalassococcus profundi]|uniref:Extensin-like protein n=2 Tax=Thalassococcus profundi TaxID=2282382 RepID=A0A369TV73_9RHOB|nr:extensin-like protein [Thalassococcus profundi]